MTLFGIRLQRPSFAQVTSSVILGVGLWAALLGLLQASGQEVTRVDAACALAVVLWSCVAVQIGIHVGRGPRHLALNVAVSALLLGALQAGAWAFGA
jgi:hypothetical protein